MNYTNREGRWQRRTFLSREDDVIVTQLSESDKGCVLDVDVSIDDPKTMRKFGISKRGIGPETGMRYEILAADGKTLSYVAHYPDFAASEINQGGYAGATRLLISGGTQQRTEQGKTTFIRVTQAKSIVIIAKIDRTWFMHKDSNLLDSLHKDIDNFIAKYSDHQGSFSCESALQPHWAKQADLFHRVGFSLGSSRNKDLPNEDLIQLQKTSGRALDTMVAYTMEANVNVQAGGMNTGNLKEAGISYMASQRQGCLWDGRCGFGSRKYQRRSGYDGGL